MQVSAHILCEEYKKGASLRTLERKYHKDRRAIRTILENNSIQLRSLSDSNRKYKLNEKAFDTITEASAYWIGFLMADGCVKVPKKGNRTISLQLASIDVNHLEKFKSFLGTDKPIYIETKGNTRDHRKVSVVSDHIAKVLQEFGVVPRKTYTAAIKHLENNRHFWRGFIDGDGAFNHIDNNSYFYLGCASSTLISQLMKFIKTFSFTESQVYIDKRKKKTFNYVMINGIYAREIVKHLYENATIGLDRKVATAQNIIDLPKSAFEHQKLTLLTYQDQTKTIASWARYLNIKPQTITSRLRRGWEVNKALSMPAKKGNFNGPFKKAA